MILDSILETKARAFDPQGELAKYILYGGGAESGSGIAVGPDTAMRCATVFSCVKVLAESVAQLPMILYRRRRDGGKERATDHPVYPLLHDRPNKWQTSYTWREQMMTSLCLRGNAPNFVARIMVSCRSLSMRLANRSTRNGSPV